MTREEKQKAIDVLKISAPVRAVTQEEFSDYIQILNKIMDWLEQEPCEDCISRQAVIDCYKKWQPYIATRLWEFEKELSALPSVTPKQKTGHWIKVTNGRGGHECDVCRDYAPSYKNGDEHLTAFCPNCGAKMTEGSEE